MGFGLWARRLQNTIQAGKHALDPDRYTSQATLRATGQTSNFLKSPYQNSPDA